MCTLAALQVSGCARLAKRCYDRQRYLRLKAEKAEEDQQNQANQLSAAMSRTALKPAGHQHLTLPRSSRGQYIAAVMARGATLAAAVQAWSLEPEVEERKQRKTLKAAARKEAMAERKRQRVAKQAANAARRANLKKSTSGIDSSNDQSDNQSDDQSDDQKTQ